jgi:hypothetical protein
MDGHNDVINENVRALLAALYRLNYQTIATGSAAKLQKASTTAPHVLLQSAEETQQARTRAIQATPTSPPSPITPMPQATKKSGL